MSLSTSENLVALVTGSGKKRVGWHVADALAGRGYNIVVHYRTSSREAADLARAEAFLDQHRGRSERADHPEESP